MASGNMLIEKLLVPDLQKIQQAAGSIQLSFVLSEPLACNARQVKPLCVVYFISKGWLEEAQSEGSSAKAGSKEQ